MTRTRNPQRRIWWGAEVLEREESRGGEVEGVVDRMSWTLHQRGSINISKLAFFFVIHGNRTSSEVS